jgi:hypothetical protein
MELLRIREKSGEQKVIFYGQLLYVSVLDVSISFSFVGKSISFTKTQLGDEEFERLKNKLVPPPPRIHKIS